MSIKLFEHNASAYIAAISMLKKNGRAAVIHPTGTGKSFIAFRLCEENPDKKIIWISPSEYIYRTQLENVRKVSSEFTGDNIIFITYARLMYMTENDLLQIKASYIILDEFHRAGAQEWGRGVTRLLEIYDGIPVLGLSATNIRYLDNQRDMADELFCSNIASGMTLGEAIVRGILNPPKYIVSMYSYADELKRYEKKLKDKRFSGVRDKAQGYIEALRRSLENADGLESVFAKNIKDKSGKYIVFCSDFEHMSEMVSRAGEWFASVDKSPHIYTAYSNNPETTKAFGRFKADESGHLKLLYCIDMLNEGVHIEGVSGVILLRPTVSPIIYKQQIGRALSASGSGVPIIFDIVNNFENLYSISAIEEEIKAAITYYRDRGEGDRIVNEHFLVSDKLRDCREIFASLEETLSFSWDAMYGLAKEYYIEFGNLDVPRGYKTESGCSLGNWIDTQRKVYRGKVGGYLNEDRINKLNAVGMCWESRRDSQWSRYYKEAVRYRENYKSLDVKINYITDSGLPLGKWISNLRMFRKSGIKSAYLTKERIKLLDELGMIWNVPDYLWEQNYMAALAYYRKFGNLEVDSGYISDDGIKLGKWLSLLRTRRNNNSELFNLTAEQIKALDELGMCWEGKRQSKWNAAYREAREYYNTYNNLDVPKGYKSESGFELGEWIRNQREYGPRMCEEKRKRLEEIGMIWKKVDSWEKRFCLAREYYKENGCLDVPPGYVKDGVWLNKWLNEQKLIYLGKREGKKLSQNQIEKLQSIGMDWKSSAERAWEVRYDAVCDFYKNFGHIEIPNDYILSDGRKIGGWLVKQRTCYKNGKLTGQQIEKLEKIGMRWERRAS